MDRLELEAEELKREYPGCKELIKHELDRIRERGRMGEFQGVDLSEILNSFRTTIQHAPCAQKRKRIGRSKTRGRRR